MERNRAQSKAITRRPRQPQQRPLYWLPVASGMLTLTVGVQGTANALGEWPGFLGQSNKPTSELGETDNTATAVDTNETSSVEPALLRPRFSQASPQAQQVRPAEAPPAFPKPIRSLEDYRRDLHRRSNAVESQLLGLQQLLSIQAYGTSFADRLLVEDEGYQVKLRQLQSLEAELLQAAIAQADTATFNQIYVHLYNTDRELRRIAQTQLQRHIDQAQTNSTLGLWQEPMYVQSLRWLMEHTHERHQLKARQQTFITTMVQSPHMSAESFEIQS
ncbi:hypothetical protein Lepto7375DRAFT_2854 [Leptolyngbya sp. PCC 7375]|nr:hypothetical protein Lepto7375DRAFT_2854 [Leptolyngbya sp. PCC 7375]